MHCEFKTDTWYGETVYACSVSKEFIRQQTDEDVLKFAGLHEESKTNADVILVEFIKCRFIRFPRGLTKTFPNLRGIYIEEGNLYKITNDELVEYKNLEILGVCKNRIEYLPANLFNGLETKLKVIDFENNRLKLVDANILDGFDDGQLEHLDLEGYLSFSVYYSIIWPHDFGTTLNEVKKFLNNVSNVATFRNLNNEIERLQIHISNLKEPKLQADIKNFVQKNESMRDFTITVNSREFRVHKLLIAARSPTLADMLINNQNAENLNLTDISIELFEKILKYIYTDEIPFDDNEIDLKEFFAAADRLKIEDLTNFAAEKLISLIDSDNAVELLKLSVKHGHEEFKSKAFNEVKAKYLEYDFEDELLLDVEKILKLSKILSEKEEFEREFQRKLNDIL